MEGGKHKEEGRKTSRLKDCRTVKLHNRTIKNEITANNADNAKKPIKINIRIGGIK